MRESLGSSHPHIYRRAAQILRAQAPAGGRLLDIGCGSGGLFAAVEDWVAEYWGADIIAYEEFLAAGRFIEAHLDQGRLPLPDGCAAMITALEVIEHVENPRALLREMARLVCPGGWVLLSTPHQLSWLSLASLLLKNHFSAFLAAPGLYPAHITALLPEDLKRMARECGFSEPRIDYSRRGRIPGLARAWPLLHGRRFSDNVFLLARRP